MKQRRFGNTDLHLSEIGFGAWAIGGQSFGPVDRKQALDTLARAEELGCNFIDTAAVYGDSEAIIGEFLKTRRDRWILASKYSGQKPGLRQTLEAQLQALGTDTIDFYQIHWMPGASERHLIDELQAAKQAGKIRYTGVSLYSAGDLERALATPELDGIQLKISLLSPSPFHEYRERIRQSGKGVLARSSLEDGFLTGKYSADTRFTTPGDKRAELTPEQIRNLAAKAEAFKHLCPDDLPLLMLATRYVLSFPEVTSLLLSSKTPAQADTNFGQIPAGDLPPDTLQRIARLQTELRLFDNPDPLRKLVHVLRRWLKPG
ncbi:aldo/keto reductase [Thioalkalivibrio sulfidiphilus]|uniref:aldo/keto reductase n=1 Tax=Thioalkalivibrio sulfidiphilus TaxID=1033854 RepID=UPI00036CE3CC|nr:aldo/keto reductase [Thioalkalivibrio sulfidiphilus]